MDYFDFKKTNISDNRIIIEDSTLHIMPKAHAMEKLVSLLVYFFHLNSWFRIG
jgi:hypothetical protein